MSTPSRAAPPCAATWSTCPPSSPRPPVSRCCTCPRTGHGRSGGKPCGTTSSATARRSHEQDDPYVPCPPAIPGPTPETRGKLVQASRSLMPTPFRTAPIVQNQPRDGTKSLIHGFRLSKLIPLGYVNATVSPVHCALSIPLNPNVSGTPCGMYL